MNSVVKEPKIQLKQYLPSAARGPRLRNAVSAGTAQSNSPESDRMATVAHVVSGHDLEVPAARWTVLVEAAEPSEAIDLVAYMPNEQFDALQRVVDSSELRKARTKARAFHVWDKVPI